MYQNCCKKCGSTDLYTDQKGNNTGLYCSDCGAWIKWLSKEELRVEIINFYCQELEQKELYLTKEDFEITC